MTRGARMLSGESWQGMVERTGAVPGNRRPRIVALIPAHNEEATIGVAVAAVRAQTWLVDAVIVVADRCTDRTVALALGAGAQVLAVEANAARKAGALNEALAVLLPTMDAADAVLVVDADTVPAPTSVGVARRTLLASPEVGAVGGVFHGHPGGGILGQCQRNEYTRYAREIDRRGHRATVLSGTATLFRVGALRQVAWCRRAGLLPGGPGVYDPAALTEDNEITLALRTLGWRTVSPRGCRVTTELMPTWWDLWLQRRRWQAGALANLCAYGLTRVTAPYVVKQAVMHLGIAAMALYAVVTAWWAAVGGGVTVRPWWLAVGGLFWLERVVTVWSAGRRAVLLAALVLPEMAYDLFQQAVYVRCLIDAVRGRTPGWHHVATPAFPVPAGTVSATGTPVPRSRSRSRHIVAASRRGQ